MIIYHGSENIVEKPQYGYGRTNNDYGRGFYCTKELELAKEWACGDNRDGWANRYELDDSSLKVLNLNEEPYNILNWLALLADNRTYWQNGSISFEAKKYLREVFLIDISEYDVIIGYRADDSYFSFAQDFVSGVISLQKLSKAMRLGKLGEQIVLKSRKAFDNLTFIDNIVAPSEVYFPERSKRDSNARRDYRKIRDEGVDIQELFMIDIMREGIANGDLRLSL